MLWVHINKLKKNDTLIEEFIIQVLQKLFNYFFYQYYIAEVFEMHNNYKSRERQNKPISFIYKRKLHLRT